MSRSLHACPCFLLVHYQHIVVHAFESVGLNWGSKS
jgi:hypothetical protein